jgi:pilus assembly protein CpaB
MRARTLLVLLVAVVLGGGTTFLARAWLASQRQQAVAEATPVALPMPSRSVLIARAAIAPGRILKPEDMVWQPWPDGGIDKSYIVIGTRKPEDFAGWVSRQPLAAGEPLTEGKMIAPGNRGFLAAVLRPGMRAISVPVTVTTGISGFIFPGDEVDIMITYLVPNAASKSDDSPRAKYDHKAAETVMHNVRVIAIDQKTESKAGEAFVAHTATLEVTPKQSEMIVLASEIGKLSLSLRSLVPGEVEAVNASDSPKLPPIPTVTLDSEVSPLLPKPLKSGGEGDAAEVTILRGSAKASESAAQSSANPALPNGIPALPNGGLAPFNARPGAPPLSRGS